MRDFEAVLAELNADGIVLRDPERGLIDFPAVAPERPAVLAVLAGGRGGGRLVALAGGRVPGAHAAHRPAAVAVPVVLAHNVDGARPPVVFLHTWLTEADHLRALAEYLGPDQPLYAVEPPDPLTQPLPQNVDEWLAWHRPHFETLPVQAPYRLAGYSWGGVCALELARRLRAEGRDVEWVGLIDSLCPRINPRGIREPIEHHLREMLGLPRGRRRGYLAWRVKRFFRLKRRAARKWRRSRQRAVLVRLGLAQSQAEVIGPETARRRLTAAVTVSYVAYQAAPYEGQAAIFPGPESVGRAGGDIEPAMGPVPARRVRAMAHRGRPPRVVHAREHRVRGLGPAVELGAGLTVPKAPEGAAGRRDRSTDAGVRARQGAAGTRAPWALAMFRSSRGRPSTRP